LGFPFAVLFACLGKQEIDTCRALSDCRPELLKSVYDSDDLRTLDIYDASGHKLTFFEYQYQKLFYLGA